MNNILNNKDEMIISLVHYFVTEENYTPINVQGAQNEIWLENLEAPYKIIRINSKYIHNDEQLNFDLFKMQFVLRQIKKKTLSLKMNVLNICLDLNKSIKVLNDNKNVNTINIENINDLKKDKKLLSYYPKMKNNSFKKTDNLDKIINITDDINRKTQKENGKYEDIFRPKKIIMTKIIIILCIAMYIVTLLYSNSFSVNNGVLVLLGANHKGLVLNGEVYRLITSAFLHANLFHLLVNMYSLWLIGSQVENFIGKWQFLVIYLLSTLMGSLFSLVFLGNHIAVGASGAIFGLMASLIYFGYHYRLYLAGALTSQIIPIVILNLVLGFIVPGIDNGAHIGGLIGGYLGTMIVGLKYKKSNSERINGLIVYVILSAFLVYVILKLV